MRGLILGLGIGSRRGGVGGGAGPVNLVAPAITGALTNGSELTFDVGLWSGTVTTFEISVTQTSPTATLLARQTVVGNTTGTLTTDVGGSLTLNVWATGPGGTTLASSAVFGPIIAAGDTWIFGLVLASSGSVTPGGSPVSYDRLGPSAESGMAYDAGRGWGWVGPSAVTISGITRSDVRLQARQGGDLDMGDAHLRVTLPSYGTYIVHAGLGADSTVTPSLRLVQGTPWTGSNPLLLGINTSRATSTTSTQTMDATGAVVASTSWTSASTYGGNPATFTISSGSLDVLVGRPAGAGATQWNNISFLKQA